MPSMSACIAGLHLQLQAVLWHLRAARHYWASPACTTARCVYHLMPYTLGHLKPWQRVFKGWGCDLQRNTARAWWHLAAAEGQRGRLLECGGLAALLRLADTDTTK